MNDAFTLNYIIHIHTRMIYIFIIILGVGMFLYNVPTNNQTFHLCSVVLSLFIINKYCTTLLISYNRYYVFVRVKRVLNSMILYNNYTWSMSIHYVYISNKKNTHYRTYVNIMPSMRNIVFLIRYCNV